LRFNHSSHRGGAANLAGNRRAWQGAAASDNPLGCQRADKTLGSTHEQIRRIPAEAVSLSNDKSNYYVVVEGRKLLRTDHAAVVPVDSHRSGSVHLVFACGVEKTVGLVFCFSTAIIWVHYSAMADSLCCGFWDDTSLWTSDVIPIPNAFHVFRAT
jgi:hypothetical protein